MFQRRSLFLIEPSLTDNPVFYGTDSNNPFFNITNSNVSRGIQCFKEPTLMSPGGSTLLQNHLQCSQEDPFSLQKAYKELSLPHFVVLPFKEKKHHCLKKSLTNFSREGRGNLHNSCNIYSSIPSNRQYNFPHIVC